MISSSTIHFQKNAVGVVCEPDGQCMFHRLPSAKLLRGSRHVIILCWENFYRSKLVVNALIKRGCCTICGFKFWRKADLLLTKSDARLLNGKIHGWRRPLFYVYTWVHLHSFSSDIWPMRFHTQIQLVMVWRRHRIRRFSIVFVALPGYNSLF